MKKVNRFLTIISAFIFSINSLSVYASDIETLPTDSTEIEEEILVPDFSNSEITAVNSEEGIKYTINEMEVSYKNNQLYIDFILIGNEEKMPISIEALPVEGTFDINKDKAIMGKVTKVTNGFEVVNLRLEERAANITLMPINLDLEGKQIISLGIKNGENTYYFQSELPNLDFTGLYKTANNNINVLTEDERRKLEESYLYMNPEIEAQESEVVVQFDDISCEDGTEEDGDISYNEGIREPDEEIQQDLSQESELISEQSAEDLLDFLDLVEEEGEVYSPDVLSRGVVHTKVPDSIFKSGTFYTWKHYHASTYCYSYVTYRFAGTENRESHIVFMEYANDSKGSPHKITLKVVKNMYVLYNVYNKKISAKTENRVRVKDLKLTLESNTKNGVFTSRKYWGVSKKSTLSKVVNAAIGWTKYNKILNTYKALKGSDLNANQEWSYQPTAKKQKDLYGNIIGGITASCKEIRYPNDYFSLQGKGNGISSIKATYKYSVAYQ